MQSAWKHDEIFPIIAHIIERQYRGNGRYIPSREIASELLRDPEGRPLLRTRSHSSVNLRHQSERPSRWLRGLVADHSRQIPLEERVRANQDRRTLGLQACDNRAYDECRVRP
jgi:hypothetical protein